MVPVAQWLEHCSVAAGTWVRFPSGTPDRAAVPGDRRASDEHFYMDKEYIKPAKPIILEDFYCYIKSQKNQVEIGDIQKKAKNDGYREQAHRHITILGGVTKRNLEKVLNSHSTKEKRKLIAGVKKLLHKFDWQFQSKKIYHVSKKGIFGEGKKIEKRQSYIRTIVMPDMKKFYIELNSILRAKLPVQFPHITLFTRGERKNPDYYGISIPSTTDFNRLCPRFIKSRI